MPAKGRLGQVKIKSKKPGKSKFRPSIQAKRRQNYYKTGKGSSGLLIRRPRVVRYIRKFRREHNLRYAEITSTDVSTKKEVMYKGVPDVFVGALDAMANQVVALAADFAKQRPHKGGIKLRKSDLIIAMRTIKNLKSQ